MSPAWISVEGLNHIPNGKWLIRAIYHGFPTILVGKVADSPRLGRKVLWQGGAASEQFDQKWWGYKFTHYAPFSAFAEVCEEDI